MTSAPGLEGILAEELRGLGFEPALEPSGAVALAWDEAAAARVLVRSRVASRVYGSVRSFASRNQAMLYDQVRRIDWPALFPSSMSIAVGATGSVRGADFVLSFAPLKIKDAICDEFRKRGHLRPDVDRHDPDVRLNAYFFEGRCELSLDLTGRPLHRRGYRAEGAEAPLRENRAAALLLFAGYDGSRPFVDPFCGSGTLAIEAAWIATRTAPGLLRPADSYAWPRLVPDALPVLEAERRRAAEERVEASHPIVGSDLSEAALAVARGNAALAGAGEVRFVRADALELEAPESWVVSNPPYGERLSDPAGAGDLLREFVHRLKHHAVGSRLALVLPRELEAAVGLRPEKKLSVESGPMALRYLVYAIRAGRFTGR